MELFTTGSLNTFAKRSNVNASSRIVCYDIRDLGKQLLPVGILVVLDSITATVFYYGSWSLQVFVWGKHLG